jgi:hypothetical protein
MRVAVIAWCLVLATTPALAQSKAAIQKLSDLWAEAYLARSGRGPTISWTYKVTIGCTVRTPNCAIISTKNNANRTGVLALLGIAAGLGEIATDDVASVADLDLLGLELGEVTRSPRYDQRDAFVQRIRSVGGMVELSTSGRDKSTTMFEHVI